MCDHGSVIFFLPDFDLALLLLARESGVQRSSLGGADIDNIGERFSDESSGGL